MFPKRRLTAVLLLVLILSLVTACSLLNSPPVADFFVFPESGSAPLVVSFDASSSSDTDGIIVAYQWEFGDGTTGSGKTRAHTYGLPGAYTAILTVTDNHGVEESASQAIQVAQAAITASFVANPTSGESPLSVGFDASGSFDPDGESITYAWSFGDGSAGAGLLAGHTYYTAGIYAVLLTVRNGSGDEDQATVTIAVLEAPIAGNARPTASFTATPASGEAPLVVNFNASASSDPDGSITSYAWSFGDSGNASGTTAIHTYTSVGTYTARLIVTDNDGATNSTTTQIEVSVPSVPENLYVDANNGSDTYGDGTQGNPYKTITKALTVARRSGSGCILHVAAGIYSTGLGEKFPLNISGISLVGEGDTKEDVKIIGAITGSFGNVSITNVHLYPYQRITLRGGTPDDRHIPISKRVILENIAITPSGKGSDTYIRVDEVQELRIANCFLSDYSCEIRYVRTSVVVVGNTLRDVKIEHSTGVTITDNNLRRLVLRNYYSPAAVIRENVIYDGIEVDGSAIASIERNIIRQSGTGILVRTASSGTNIIADNVIEDCIRGIIVGYVASADIAHNSLKRCGESINITNSGEATIQGNHILESDVSIHVDATAVADLGGGALDSTGGNVITRSREYDIKDTRVFYSGPLYAKNNIWDDPQPSGTVNGPVESPPNYFIENEGNSIIFSD